ncbi:MAG: undecaprenyldiphospho-muramoylpentapeptide beta-N-acetylglucosaminyltransferase [Proteobacteria bacterium]|jgi:UDP-N-acetylglucosamine--N-acetylmuramyl-(pentapeptide) pyrophosphoryl-undecaprenol N-acetylglucosamine transferase|nr:undecaprenyldiphospho-muramoylpentapeptide beta-N-acetylglucosaminyltransferase [Pseudomonadota bacterium]
MNAPRLKVVLTGGGTGGHVIPAIAVAEEITRRGGEARFIGTADRLEARLVPAAGFDIDFINVRPLRGNGARGVLRGAASVPWATLLSIALLKRLSPDVVLGVGGYVAGPVVLAAKILFCPTAVLEQNATVGFSNKVVARLVDRAFVTYEETIGAFPRGRAELTGNPLKRAILEARERPRRARAGRARLLVMGGSQGALTIDTRVPEALGTGGLCGEVSVLHQCGRGRRDAVAADYAERGIEARVVEFIDDTASAYLDADLVIARSGATTVAELAAMGLPAILIPYPHHADRQQEKNAAPLRLAGAAIVLDELTTGVDELAAAVRGLVRDGSALSAAAKGSRALGRPDAARRIVDGLERLAKRRP